MKILKRIIKKFKIYFSELNDKTLKQFHARDYDKKEYINREN